MEFPNNKFKQKKDSYLKTRGGTSRLLYIACGSCEEPVLVYQKDGPGKLIRLYMNRIIWPPEAVDYYSNVTTSTIKQVGTLACSSCNNTIATPTIYGPERRTALRLIPGTTHAYRSIEQAQARLKDKK